MKRSIKKSNRRKLQMQPLESRRVLAASLGWDGPGLGSAELTYHIANSPDSLSQAETNAAIETALAAWSAAADVTFTPTNQSGRRDSIDISFVNIDGAGRTLAQAYFPDDINPARIAGDIQFDSSEVWEVGNTLGNRAFDLVWVAAHEIGHSLGLDHTGVADSILSAFVSPNQSFTGLSSSDVAEIQTLYAGPEESQDPTDPIVPSESNVPEQDAIDPSSDSSELGDPDDAPFPRHLWRRGGHWQRFGHRLDAELPENHNPYQPTDVNGDDLTTALDALTVINQLGVIDNASADGDPETTHRCDANGDGVVSAGDALMVINALNADGQTEDPTITIGQTEDPVDQEQDPSDPQEGPADEREDPAGESDPIDQTDEAEPIDDGGLTDEDEVEGDESEQNDCPDRRRRHLGLLIRTSEQLISRFDTNQDQSLTEDELPAGLWEKLVELAVDGDENGVITADELDLAISRAREQFFGDRDADEDGLIVESEVSSRLWAKLSAADTDGDAAVSFDELSVWLDTVEFPGHDHGQTDDSPPHRHHDRVFAALGRAPIRGRLGFLNR